MQLWSRQFQKSWLALLSTSDSSVLFGLLLLTLWKVNGKLTTSKISSGMDWLSDCGNYNPFSPPDSGSEHPSHHLTQLQWRHKTWYHLHSSDTSSQNSRWLLQEVSLKKHNQTSDVLGSGDITKPQMSWDQDEIPCFPTTTPLLPKTISVILNRRILSFFWGRLMS